MSGSNQPSLSESHMEMLKSFAITVAAVVAGVYIHANYVAKK
jgi:hypothetical protein